MKAPNNTKRNCGQFIASSCVPFTGPQLTFPKTIDLLDCDSNLNDVVYTIDQYLQPLVSGNDFTLLQKGCLDFVPATVSAKQLHQLEITNICLLLGQTEALQEQFDEFNIGTHEITITLPECLTASAAPCLTSPNTYQLISLLNLYAAKICDLETRLQTLES